jgi:hypothetical protein
MRAALTAALLSFAACESTAPPATPPRVAAAIASPTPAASTPRAPTTAPAASGRVDASALRAALGTCVPLPNVTAFRSDAHSAPSIQLCGRPGAVWWSGDLDVDCDGGTEPACHADRTFLGDTAARDAHGRPLDASHLPYVVVPQSSNGFDFRASGLRLGSVVAVMFRDRLEYAVVGDLGPRGVIGEGSFALAERLGINPDPNRGGVAAGVTYVAFTGADAVIAPVEDRTKTEEVGAQRAAALIDAAGQR